MSQHLAFRRLRRPRWMAVTLSGVILAIGLRLFAQDQGLDPGIAPNARVGRSTLTRPDLHVDPDDPEVDQLLIDWSAHTSRFKTLAGKHYRATRNFVYGVETLAEGKFFVKMPDEGRIDVGVYTPATPKPGDIKTYSAPNGTPTKMKIESEKKQEKWICDGKTVRVIDDTRRTYEEVKIPPNQQGANMIDGPLPFLLGMPPDKAKARYRFQIVKKVGQDRIWLEVKPKFALDAAEWVRAYVLLNLGTYLPDRVSLFDPDGNKETVYLFHDIQVNQQGLLQRFFGSDPFSPRLWDYRREVHAVQDRGPKDPDSKGPKMPMLIGAKDKDALRISKALKEMGFDVQFEQGPIAPNADQLYRIESQSPEANTPLQPGQKILLRYYWLPRTATKPRD
jgi:TIGR03009 family protein